MKKLMIAAAIVCAAAMSHGAASISWGNGSTSKIVGLTGTAISAANAEAWNLTVQLMMVGDDEAFATADTISSMTAGVLDSTQTKKSYTYDTDATNGDQFYILAKMTVDGKNYEMIVDNNWAIAATDNKGTDTFTWAAGTYGGLGVEGDKGKWVAQSVPEPTSGLLLLLGIGAMALRRRRA